MRGMVSACGADPELATAFYEQVVGAKRAMALDAHPASPGAGRGVRGD